MKIYMNMKNTTICMQHEGEVTPLCVYSSSDGLSEEGYLGRAMYSLNRVFSQTPYPLLDMYAQDLLRRIDVLMTVNDISPITVVYNLVCKEFDQILKLYVMSRQSQPPYGTSNFSIKPKLSFQDEMVRVYGGNKSHLYQLMRYSLYRKLYTLIEKTYINNHTAMSSLIQSEDREWLGDKIDNVLEELDPDKLIQAYGLLKGWNKVQTADEFIEFLRTKAYQNVLVQLGESKLIDGDTILENCIDEWIANTFKYLSEGNLGIDKQSLAAELEGFI